MKYLAIALLLTSCAHQDSVPDAPKQTPTPPKVEVQCAGTKMYGWSSPQELTTQDYENYQAAIKRCPELYPEAPCLTYFVKSGEGSYKAICGSTKGAEPKQPESEPI